RGEVALRVVRACAHLGLRSIAAYTAQERDSLPVRTADASVEIPGAGAAAYLDSAALVSAAASSGATLVHPGYGFLSEDAGFARALDAAGIGFAGPDADTLALLGDKTRALSLARELGVPVL